MKTKLSVSLTLDLGSVVQFIKSAHYQAYVWFHGYEKHIQDGEVMLAWFGLILNNNQQRNLDIKWQMSEELSR